MKPAAGLPIGDTLYSGGYLPQDPHLVASKTKLATLKVGDLEPQVPDHVVVDECGDRGGEIVGEQDGKRPALAGKNVLLVRGAILVAGGEHSSMFGLFDHRWFKFDLIPLSP